MNDRDELAREIFIGDNFRQPREYSIVDWEWLEKTVTPHYRTECYKAIADAILATGWIKPRTITTVEELDALPHEAVVQDAGGFILEHWEEPEDRIWKAAGNEWAWSTDDITLPAQLLYAPEPSA
jgi:hypothetical protein